MAAGSSRGGDWRALRLRVLERDGHICVYCGAEATEADHVLPKVAGGEDREDNLVAACKPCNGRKGGRVKVRMPWFNRAYLARL